MYISTNGKITTGIFQGAPPLRYFFVSLVKGIGLPLDNQVVSVPLTEDNNGNFARGSPTEIFLVSLVNGIGLPLDNLGCG